MNVPEDLRELAGPHSVGACPLAVETTTRCGRGLSVRYIRTDAPLAAARRPRRGILAGDGSARA